jgi:hypothetical protein
VIIAMSSQANPAPARTWANPADPSTAIAPPALAAEPVPIPYYLTSVGRAAPWWGEAILFRHFPDGSVAATSLGMVGGGGEENEALADLDRRLHAEWYASPGATRQPS